MKKTAIQNLWQWCGLLVVSLLLVGCNQSADPFDLTTYRPVDEFVPAYEALTNQQLEAGEYDLEQTVRVMNALELAQANSEDFDEFLKFMAKQDFTGVAPDVLEAKQKMMPVLQYMYQLQALDKDLSDAWILARSAATGGMRMVDRVNIMDVVNTITGNPIVLLDIFHKEDAKKVTNTAFSNYKKDKELRQNVRNDIAKLEASYLKYLSDYAPIYHKYMKEYDALCVEKDKVYLELYAGQAENALQGANNILKKYPKNTEAQLLKAQAEIVLGTKQSPPPTLQTHPLPLPEGRGVDSLFLQSNNSLPHREGRGGSHFSAALSTLDDYVAQNPDKSAPALLMRGVLYQRMGDAENALSCFHQASIEYPRQAAQLTDMLDSYCMRNYLNKTAEGLYLLQLYRSMMEGYGIFSPNLLKAKYYADSGQQEESKNEIYNHFFRRGNQKYYDGMLSDMQFCEQNLPEAFKQLLIDKKFLSIAVVPASKWLVMSDQENMQVSVKNLSGKRLENVRIFLCIHYTDMHKEEYDVVKVPQTISIIEPDDEVEMESVPLKYRDKKYHDITRIRAIAMTDDRLCWVDDIQFSQDRSFFKSIVDLF
ncbi:MAG: tetratricopeptide repeat protein [Prevotella sp.]|nr:tetratricopeptide repeat protein [Prevotella sp.]